MRSSNTQLVLSETRQPTEIIPARAHAQWQQPPQENGNGTPSLLQRLWLVKRHRWRLLGFIVFCTLATIIISKRITPLYESTAVVDIDHQAPSNVIGNETGAGNNSEDMQNFLATQERIVQSDAVLRPVVEKFNLRSDAIKSLSNDQILSSRLKDAPIQLKGLTITQPPHTYLLLISYRSPDPLLSAQVANEIANSYIRHSYDIRFESASQLTDYMEKQLNELKVKMENSSIAEANFEKNLNIINPDQKTDVYSARLMQLNTDLTAAQTDRAGKEAAYNAVKNGGAGAAEASEQGMQLRQLEARLDEAKQHFAEVQSQFGSSHPKYKQAESQVNEIQTQIDALRQNVTQQVFAAYQQAVNREALLQRDMLSAKADFDQINAKSFEYKALKQEADTDKELYEQLIKKIREAGINASFPSSSIRLADGARPALYPAFPKTWLNTLIALFGSTIIGLSMIFLMDALNTRIVDIEALQRELRVPVLPSLPTGKFTQATLPMYEAGTEAGEAFALATPNQLAAADGVANRAFHEAIRTLRSSIMLSAGLDRVPKSILVTSACPAEGKSTITLYLATANSLQKRRTLLIDCDLRRPVMRMTLSKDRGLSDVVNGSMHWREAMQSPAEYPHLDILTAGPASRLVADGVEEEMRGILEEAEREYDLVVVDSPPLLGFAETLEIASMVDGVVLIARAERTTRTQLSSAVQQLRGVHANILGVLLNGINSEMSNNYYYYTSEYYTHYMTREER